MPAITGNQLNGSGLTLANQAEITAYLTTNYQAIYGPQINLGPNTQDGEMLAIYVQSTLDEYDIFATLYACRDINQAVGTQLDTLIYWIQRLGGTYSQYLITITVSQALTLYGQDQTTQPVFTIADASGNQYQLVSTHSFSGAGTVAGFVFEAVDPGAVESGATSITVPVTNVLGVTSFTNPSGTPSVLGINAETDAAFRLRALASVAIPSQGFFNGLYAGLSNIPGESKIILCENYLQSTSPNAATSVPGIPGNCIWVIAQGVASPATIAQTIYNQRSLGCNMKGAQSYNITQADGSTFTVYWDNVVEENIFIKFTATSINGTTPPQLAAILAGLPALLQPVIGATMNVNQVQAAVQQIDPNTLVTSAGLSTTSGGSYTNTLSPTAANYQFQVLSANIIITPMILNPLTSTVAHSTGTVNFQALGGYGTITYSISTNNSGGSIDSSTGVYTAGATHPATDSLSNTATATVTVT